MTVIVDLKYYKKTAAGDVELPVQLPDGATLGDLISKLKDMLPELRRELDFGRYIIDGRLIAFDTVLSDNCTVNLLYPMSGG